MNEKAVKGKSRFISFSISVLLISLFTILLYQQNVENIPTSKYFSQGVRFVLTGALLYQVYLGKLWAKKVMIVLLLLGSLWGILALMTFPTMMALIIFGSMIFTYCYFIYFLYMSEDFIAFFEYQNQK